MYSMILMAALTTGADTPDIGRRGGGCGGCYGGCYGGGCYGGGCYGGGGRMRGGRRGGGCHGCYGGYAYGCYGGCYGGWGGCYGGGMVYGGCYGGWGGCYGGGMGYGGCYGGCYGGTPMMPGAVVPGTTPEKIKDMPTPKKTQLTPASATIVVDLPADAKLSIDNEPTTSTGSSRVFVSPALNPGREYHYTLKAEVVKDGKPAMIEKVITVKAGQVTTETLALPAAGVAQH